MSKGLIDRLLDEIFDANWVGRRGEKLTERELNLVKFFGRSGKVLRNLRRQGSARRWSGSARRPACRIAGEPLRLRRI